jgi:hypothetical protein
MKKSSLEHLIRSAGDILKKDRIYIIGSQAIHGATNNIPDVAEMSYEADFFTDDYEDFEIIEGVLGEESNFHNTHNYYAQGVDEHTATLPEGWRDRINIIKSAATGNSEGACISLEDLVLSKYAAGREKDYAFISEVIVNDLVKKSSLLSLCEKMPKDKCNIGEIKEKIERDFRSSKYTKAVSEFKDFERSMLKKFAVLDKSIVEIVFPLHEAKDKFLLVETLKGRSNSELADKFDEITKIKSLGDVYSKYLVKYDTCKKIELMHSAGLSSNQSMSQAIKEISENKCEKSSSSDNEPKI